MLKYKWDNWRFIANYTERQLQTLKKLQNLYVETIKQNGDAKTALAHTFLETDTEGVPLRGVTMESMNPFDRYTESHLLTSYANLIQSKILKYLVGRLSKSSTYNNDPQSLLCIQMLQDFKLGFVGSAINDTLLNTVDNWKKFIERLKVATLPNKELLFPHHEERQLPYTLQWLLGNLNGLFSQVYQEIELELSRRTIADYLDILSHATKVTVELSFEYVAHMMTYEALPLDFNLASFYDKNIDREFHQKMLAKTWFNYLYKFAASKDIKELFFGNSAVHYELQNLLDGNHFINKIMHYVTRNEQTQSLSESSNTIFLTQSGNVPAVIIDRLRMDQLEPIEVAEKTGILKIFCHAKHEESLQAAFSLLGYLEIIARLARLIRTASYLLHQDGSLIARKETKTQLQLFIEIYQTLFIQLFRSINIIKETMDLQVDDNHRSENKKFSCNPNLEICNILWNKLEQLKKNCKESLSQIQSQLVKIDQHRKELNELVSLFKQQWFDFVGNYQWLLTQSQQQAVMELKLQENSVTKKYQQDADKVREINSKKLSNTNSRSNYAAWFQMPPPAKPPVISTHYSAEQKNNFISALSEQLSIHFK